MSGLNWLILISQFSLEIDLGSFKLLSLGPLSQRELAKLWQSHQGGTGKALTEQQQMTVQDIHSKCSSFRVE